MILYAGLDVHKRAALGDIGRFRDADHAASYLGLTPSTKQSADHCYHGPITKAGNGHARWVLVQAAQHVRLHPGPLGVFFRRLAKKKSYNVAVVATARKLVTIAWHMLTRNEPYRYAQPAATEAKLQRLRVRVTGQKRKTGPAKGAKASSSANPTRMIKSLGRIYEDEGLPALSPPPAGEARTVTESDTREYVESLEQPHRVPRRGFRSLRAATRGLIAGPWTPLASLCSAGSRTGLAANPEAPGLRPPKPAPTAKSARLLPIGVAMDRGR